MTDKILLIKYPEKYFTNYGRGLFSAFSSVINAFKTADAKGMACYVDLSQSLNYYKDQNHTNNVWTQYFTNPTLENKEVIKNTEYGHDNIFMELKSLGEISYQREVWAKFAKLNDFTNNHINNKINDYNLNRKKTLGVHIRGLDKKLETRIFPYNIWEKQIDTLYNQYGFNQTLICTDEIEAATYFKRLVPKYNIVFTDNLKTTRNVLNTFNYQDSNNFKKGLDAITDCYLLGSCNVLLRNRSNLSAFACVVTNKVETIFNIESI
jgi:hypothetical protein